MSEESSTPKLLTNRWGRRKFLKQSAIALAGTTSLAAFLAACGDNTATTVPAATTAASATAAASAGTTAAASATTASSATTAAGAATTAAASAGQKATIRFYGEISEYSHTPELIAALKDHFKDKYDIQSIKVDFSNLDTIIKANLASNDPADIYFYWPGAMKSYVDANQALDLTPYMEANSGEWKNSYNPSLLDSAKYNGKYYDAPTEVASCAIVVNQDLAQKLGVTIPEQMTWQQFVDISKQIKEKGNGVFPFGIQAQWLSWLPRNGFLSLAAEANKLEAWAKGEVPATDPIFAKSLQNVGAYYKAGYAYPGDGALTVTADEVTAAFTQGKVVMMAIVFANIKSAQKAADSGKFKMGTTGWPAMGSKPTILGGANGYFIPAKTKHPKEAVEVLQYFTGKDMQTLNAKYGLIPSIKGIDISDPLVNSLSKYSAQIYPNEFTSLDVKIGNYVDKNLVQDYVLGASESDVLGQLEQLRKSIKK